MSIGTETCQISLPSATSLVSWPNTLGDFDARLDSFRALFKQTNTNRPQLARILLGNFCCLMLQSELGLLVVNWWSLYGLGSWPTNGLNPTGTSTCVHPLRPDGLSDKDAKESKMQPPGLDDSMVSHHLSQKNSLLFSLHPLILIFPLPTSFVVSLPGVSLLLSLSLSFFFFSAVT